eukprot:152776_1
MLHTFELELFRDILYYGDEVKAVMAWESDGAGDESAKSDKWKKIWLYVFRKYDLDYILHYNSPPGNSAYNFIERRMCPFSKSLVGFVVDHLHHGNHLNASKKTIDTDLEEKNFLHGQKSVAELFEKVVVEDHGTKAEAIKPTSFTDRENVFGGKLTKRDRLFLSRHAEQGSLSFQLYKCTNPTCCKPLRSNIRQFLPTGRLPTPTLFERKDNGHIVAVKPNTKPTKDMRFGDLFMNRTLSPANNVSIDTYRHDIPLEKRKESMCSVCMKSFANKTQKENHRKACHRGNVGTQIEDEDLELDEVPMYDVIGDEALKIIGKRNGLYLVQYADSTEWAQLSDECPLVKDFKED